MKTLTCAKLVGLLSFITWSTIISAQQLAPKIGLVNDACASKTAARIGVFFSGITELDGKPTSLPDLKQALQDRAAITEVCYYRERPESEDAPKQAEHVLNAIIKENLPLAFFWDAQFQQRVAIAH